MVTSTAVVRKALIVNWKEASREVMAATKGRKWSGMNEVVVRNLKYATPYVFEESRSERLNDCDGF